MNKQNSSIFLLILLVGFLISPSISLADDFENITLTEIKKYLPIPEKEVNALIHSLIKLFYSEWIDLMASGYSTEEERAVPSIMKKVAQVQALNHLLVDAPIQTSWAIIKNATKIARVFLAQDPSVILNELEKESVQKAVSYGMSILLEKEIRISPGAIDFEYTSQKGEKKIAPFQYIVVYKPFNSKRGEILIRFYSPKPIEPPENSGSAGLALGIYTDLTHDLSPFIVDIQGTVENYQWIGTPSMHIDFPPSVPDLGIRPLSFWERNVLKPIKTTIKEIEIIITKVTGGSTKIGETLSEIYEFGVDVWSAIKSTASQFNPFGAGVVQNLPSLGQESEETEEAEPLAEARPPQITEPVQNTGESAQVGPVQLSEKEKEELKKKELQEFIDDLLEQIDWIQAEIARPTRLTKEKEVQELIKEKLEDEEKLEEEEEIEENEEVGQEIGQILCQKITEVASLQNKIIFNEIAWMGTANSANDEWIELKNVSGASIDLTGWQILDKDNQIKIIFDGGRASTNGFWLLERTSDNSVPGIKADFIYTGGLSNTNEALYLFDKNCQLQDFVEANPDWPAGDNSSKRTMERKSDLGWQASANVGGTPKAENSSGYIIIDTAGGGAEAPPPAPPNYPKILISEIQISPIENRFIELYNPNDSQISLTGWYIQRKTETGTSWDSLITSTQFEGKIIQPKSYFLISRTLGNSDILLTDLTLTENNSLVLKNPNREIVDKLGWGTAQEYETAPASNPSSDKSLGRKWLTDNQIYQDTNNNSADFEIQQPTPKAQNQALPNQSPTASFTFSPQIPFIDETILFNASSTDPDGQITSFFWDFGDGNSTTTNQTTTSYSYATSGSFTVSLQVQDNQGASSLTATTTLNITERPTLSVVINEIAWMGTSAANPNDEWLELYNNTTSIIDLAGWTLKSADGTPSITFSTSSATTTIPALGFYLLERTNSQTISDISADQIYTGALENGGEKLELRDANNNLIDLVDASAGWFAGATSPAYLSMERINPRASGSSASNWANNNQIIKNGLDENQNPINGTPKAQNSVYQSLPPEAVPDLTIDETESWANIVFLTWSPATDSDTLSENLSYEIYYLKESLNEGNLAQASIASTTATTTLISGLDYSSTYYFGIKSFDGENYSPLAISSSPHQTATLSTIASNFSASDLSTNYLKNNGRKIARTSNGDLLYVVYSRGGRIFLAKSSDQGINWTEIEASPQGELDQINPSIAVDSQDNLHLVWQGKVGTSTVYQIRYAKYDGISFPAIEDLTNSEWDQEIPVVAVDSQNNVHVVWVNKQQTWNSRDNQWVAASQLLHRVFTTQWEVIETVAEIYKGGFSSFALAVDSQENLHLISRESRFWDTGSEKKIQYRKRTNQEWAEIGQLSSDDLQNDFPSLVIDNQNNLHLVWYRPYSGASEIKYLKYISQDASFTIETLDSNEFTGQWVIASPSIALDSQGHLYVIWKRLNEKISLKEYSDSWKNIKNFDLGSLNSFAFTNLLWSFYPVNTNQPKTGYAFIFYQGTDLKFYASQDLTWE